jgi:hypothetical protein
MLIHKMFYTYAYMFYMGLSQTILTNYKGVVWANGKKISLEFNWSLVRAPSALWGSEGIFFVIALRGSEGLWFLYLWIEYIIYSL